MLAKSKLLILTLLTLLGTSVFAAVDTQYKATVCGSGAYLFGCQTLTSSGPAVNTLGDSTVHLNLLFAAPKAVAYSADIEPGQTYLFGCQALTDKGEANNTLQQIGSGCDSTVTLTLSVVAPPTPTNITVSYEANLTLGETYLFGCDLITPAALGDHNAQRTIARVGGGDSIIKLTLHVLPVPKPEDITVSYEANLTLGETYLFGCDLITPAALGDHNAQRTIARVGGGDSIINLTLHVLPVPSMDIAVSYEANLTLGETYLFGCDVITPAVVGDLNAQRNIARAGVGDSTINLTLHVLPVPSMDIAVSYEANLTLGETYLFGCEAITPAVVGDLNAQRTIARAGVGDSTINLTLHVLPVPSLDITVAYEANLTLGETYLFGCEAITPAAVGDLNKQRTIARAAGGDSIINLTLHVLPVPSLDITVAYEADLTLGETYLFGCEAITPDAVGDVLKQKTLARAAGGDSIINLTLHVKSADIPNVTVSYDAIIEAGETYLLGCQAYQFDDTGMQKLYNTLPAANGGDSIIIVNLAVIAGGSTDPIWVKYTADIYEGETYLFGCDTMSKAGEYTNMLKRTNGSDSIITLTLSVLPVPSQDITVSYEADLTLGETYLFGCEAITPDAVGDVTKQKTLDRVAGGDSIINLTLHVLPVPSQDITVSYEADLTLGETYLFGCEAITPDAVGDVTKQKTLDRVAGGDSIINLTLHVLPVPVQDTAVQYSAQINLGETYLFGCDAIKPLATGTIDTVKTIGRIGLDGDSTIYLHLTVLPVCVDDTTFMPTPVTSCGTYVWDVDGQPYSATGKYYYNEGPVSTACDHYIELNLIVNNPATGIDAVSGCDSVLFKGEWFHADTVVYDTITGGAANLCDSIVTVTITINHPIVATTPIEVSGCDSVFYKGIKYTANDVVYDTLPGQASNLCDSIVQVNIVVNHPVTATIPIEYIGCDSVQYKGKWYFADQQLFDTLPVPASNGCDSIALIYITVDHTVHGATTLSGCDFVMFKGIKYTADTLVYDTIIGGASATGCDSITAVTIDVDAHAEGVDEIIGCDSALFKGKWFYADTLVYDTLIYAAANLCDSIVAVTITINHPVMGTIPAAPVTGCDSVLYKGVKYFADATAYDTIYGGASNLCDSIIPVPIVVYHATKGDTTATECDIFVWYEHNITVSGDYDHTFADANVHGCDSIVTLHIVINHTDSSTVDEIDTCNLYEWHGQIYTETGIYYDTLQTANNCDSICKLDLKIATPYIDTLTLEHYYGDRVLMVNRLEINAIPGWHLDSLDTEHPEYVKWYRIEANGDTTYLGTENDGYYYTTPTGDPVPAGTYFAVITIAPNNGARCGAKGMTETYTVAAPAPAPALVPSLARPGEDIRVINLDPTAETTIRLFTAEGVLQKVITTNGETSCTFKAAYGTGFYLVEVYDDNMKSTLRYIVK